MQTKNHIHKANLCKGSKSIGLTAKQNSCKYVNSQNSSIIKHSTNCKIEKEVNKSLTKEDI